MTDDKNTIADALTEAKRLTANVFWAGGNNISHLDRLASACELLATALENSYTQIDALKAQLARKPLAEFDGEVWSRGVRDSYMHTSTIEFEIGDQQDAIFGVLSEGKRVHVVVHESEDTPWQTS